MTMRTHSRFRPYGAGDGFDGCFYKDVAPTALKNRIIQTCEAEAQAATTDAIITKVFNVFNAAPVP